MRSQLHDLLFHSSSRFRGPRTARNAGVSHRERAHAPAHLPPVLCPPGRPFPPASVLRSGVSAVPHCIITPPSPSPSPSPCLSHRMKRLFVVRCSIHPQRIFLSSNFPVSLILFSPSVLYLTVLSLSFSTIFPSRWRNARSTSHSSTTCTHLDPLTRKWGTNPEIPVPVPTTIHIQRRQLSAADRSGGRLEK